MAQIITGNKVKLDNGQIIDASQGAWYDSRQFWGGTLSEPGQINKLSNQIGAGQDVSKEVVEQTQPGNWDYIQSLKNKQTPAAPVVPTQAPATAPSGLSATPGTPGQGVGFTAPTTINLEDTYKTLYSSSGITESEKQILDKTNEYNDAVNNIMDNPHLSEATLTGRLKKLSDTFDRDITPLKNDIATKKADIETQLNIKTKQFDINSQAAKDALSQFNSLLEMGALDNATGDDIANIVRSTGLSSTMIQNAVSANKAKNIKTEIISYDDGVNQGFAVIDPKTGEIIKKQTIAASTKNASDGLTTTQQRDVTANARTVIQTVDEQFRTINGVVKKVEFEEDYSGDKRVSAQEYLKAVELLMSQTGVSQELAGQYVTQAMNDLGYTNWSPTAKKK